VKWLNLATTSRHLTSWYTRTSWRRYSSSLIHHRDITQTTAQELLRYTRTIMHSYHKGHSSWRDSQISGARTVVARSSIARETRYDIAERHSFTSGYLSTQTTHSLLSQLRPPSTSHSNQSLICLGHSNLLQIWLLIRRPFL
jgi:hypothetical protein